MSRQIPNRCLSKRCLSSVVCPRRCLQRSGRSGGDHMIAIPRCIVLLAVIVFTNFATTAFAADATAPTIERTGDWRAAVRRFAETNLKHPAWGFSHSVRDYELAK